MGGTKIYIFYLLFSILVLVSPAPFGANDDEYDDDGGGIFTEVKTKTVKTATETGDVAFDSLLQINENQTDDSVYSADKDSMPSLFEGDIVVNPELIQVINTFKQIKDDDDISLFDAINRGQWPKAEVPYTYRDTRTRNILYRAVNAAVQEYNAKTCIKWIEKPVGSRMPHYHVSFMIGGGCYSMIGRQSRRQEISLGNGCATKGIAIHEMMHALGFFHEQSRRDRDTYISINWSNIPQRVRYNFQMYRPSQASTLGLGYDKQSIMHYGNYAFAINRRIRTITSRTNAYETLGQRNGLSKIDVAQLNKYYQCSGTTTVTGGGKKKENINCKNKHAFCTALTSWCTDSWVKTNCEKSCKICSTTVVVPKDCKDYNAYCPTWKNQQYCTRTYVSYMSKNCKKSCGFC